MISTSSSECDFTGPFSFGSTLPSFVGNPFCPTANQPLIYYAKIQEPCCQQNRRNRKDNSNCFMKAFRWYTQELGSGPKNDLQTNGNNSGFAAWLDEKYSEYIRGSHREGSNLMLKQSSTLQADGMPMTGMTRKRFGRMRSPWKRLHRPNSKEKAFSYNNRNQSFQYILQPQDLSKPTSGCVPRTSRIQSTTTIVAKESPKLTKIKVKSKSLLSIYRARDSCNPEVLPKLETKVLCECLKKEAGTQYETFSLETFPTPYKRFREKQNNTCRCTATNKDDMMKLRISQTNVSCQCSEYEQPPNAVFSMHTQNKDPHTEHEDKRTLENITVLHQPNSKLPTVMFTNNTSGNMSELQNLSAQTSDRSINLGHVMYEQPIFLRIVHVDNK